MLDPSGNSEVQHRIGANLARTSGQLESWRAQICRSAVDGAEAFANLGSALRSSWRSTCPDTSRAAGI
jgi:hypothetical protein